LKPVAGMTGILVAAVHNIQEEVAVEHVDVGEVRA
jgi:hypothetical protein